MTTASHQESTFFEQESTLLHGLSYKTFDKMKNFGDDEFILKKKQR